MVNVILRWNKLWMLWSEILLDHACQCIHSLLKLKGFFTRKNCAQGLRKAQSSNTDNGLSSKISTLLFHKMLVRIASWEDPLSQNACQNSKLGRPWSDCFSRSSLIRLLLKKQSDLGLHCLSRPFWLATNIGIFPVAYLAILLSREQITEVPIRLCAYARLGWSTPLMLPCSKLGFLTMRPIVFVCLFCCFASQ